MGIQAAMGIQASASNGSSTGIAMCCTAISKQDSRTAAYGTFPPIWLRQMTATIGGTPDVFGKAGSECLILGVDRTSCRYAQNGRK